jgi:hypothetical protein
MDKLGDLMDKLILATLRMVSDQLDTIRREGGNLDTAILYLRGLIKRREEKMDSDSRR